MIALPATQSEDTRDSYICIPKVVLPVFPIITPFLKDR